MDDKQAPSEEHTGSNQTWVSPSKEEEQKKDTGSTEPDHTVQPLLSKAKMRAQQLEPIQTEMCESALEIKTAVTSPEEQNHRHPALFRRRQQIITSDFTDTKDNNGDSSLKDATPDHKVDEKREKVVEVDEKGKKLNEAKE